MAGINLRLCSRVKETAMDNLLMDHEDPEKRIAHLERQLAAPKRGADLPPAGAQDAAGSRRFVASAAAPSTKQMMK